MSTRAMNYSKAFPSRKNQDGALLCRWQQCGVVLTGRKTSFCSQECRDKALILCWPTEQRAQTFRRDKGVCAGCGLDCVAAWEVIRDATRTKQLYGWRQDHRGETRRTCAQEAITTFLDIKLGNRRSLWEANHIVPVAEGGTSDLDNLETLCVWCHKAHTKELKGRLTRAKRRQMEFQDAEGDHVAA